MISGAFDLTVVDGSSDVFWTLLVDSASEGDAGAEDLFAGAIESD